MLTGLILDGTKENSFRSQATNQQFGMLKYEEILTAELFQLAVIFFFSRVTDVGMNSILTRNKTISQKVVTEFSKFQGVQKLLFMDSKRFSKRRLLVKRDDLTTMLILPHASRYR